MQTDELSFHFDDDRWVLLKFLDLLKDHIKGSCINCKPSFIDDTAVSLESNRVLDTLAQFLIWSEGLPFIGERCGVLYVDLVSSLDKT